MLTEEDCLLTIETFQRMDAVEAFSVSITTLCTLVRRYAKLSGRTARVDHVRLQAILDGYEQAGLDHPLFAENEYLVDFVDLFYETLHNAAYHQYQRLDSAKSMPEVSKRLAMLEKHWSYKRNFTTSVPVQKVASLSINSFKLIMPESLRDVRLITSEHEADAVEAEILELYGHLVPQHDVPKHLPESGY